MFDLMLITGLTVLCILLQAPLTTKDTAILSGSLSTHNGNGGGSINLALRRVTSAKGWGEVCCVFSGHCTLPSTVNCWDLSQNRRVWVFNNTL